jgi:hypothetical protein
MAKQFLRRWAVVLAACLGVLATSGCGGGGRGAAVVVSVWVQNSDHLDPGGGPDGDVWAGTLGAYNIIALEYRRIDVPGPLVSVPIVPGGLDENEFVFVGGLTPGVYQFVATFFANAETDQGLFSGAPPRSSTDTPLASFASPADPVDLSTHGGKTVTLVLQGQL